MEFCVYKDNGAVTEFLLPALRQFSKPLGIDVVTLNREQVVTQCYLAKKAENIIGFWLPGNRSGQAYLSSFGMKGVEQIKEYVAGGGCYFGICAGAYLAVRNVRYTGPERKLDGRWRTVTKKRVSELAFFNGSARGELPFYTKRCREGWETATVINVGIQGVEHRFRSDKVVYWGGPAIVPAPGEDVEPLAYYEHGLPERENIAICRKKFGEGLAVISGVHPEMTAATMRAIPQPFPDYQNDLRYEKLMSQLDANPDNIKSLFALFADNAFRTGRGSDFLMSRPCQYPEIRAKQLVGVSP